MASLAGQDQRYNSEVIADLQRAGQHLALAISDSTPSNLNSLRERAPSYTPADILKAEESKNSKNSPESDSDRLEVENKSNNGPSLR